MKEREREKERKGNDDVEGKDNNVSGAHRTILSRMGLRDLEGGVCGFGGGTAAAVCSRRRRS